MYAFLQLRKLVRLVLQQAQVPSTDWQLLIVLDQAALGAPLTPMLLQQLGIATLVVIAAALLISLLVQWLLALSIARISSVRKNCQWSRFFNPSYRHLKPIDG